MYQIKTMNKISPMGLDRFDPQSFCYGEDVDKPDAILVRSASLHETELPKSLKAIARAGAGVNNIPVEKCSEKGIVVFNTPGANANAVKELVLAGLLLSSRKIVQGIQWSQSLAGQGEQIPALVEKGKGKFVGPELLGKKLGVIGLGAIGGLVANAAISLGMEVYGYDPYISVDLAWKLSRSIIHASSLKQIYENCDYITIHVPAVGDTKGMINSESIQTMKQGVRILNFSRGELAVAADVKEAVQSGRMACYVTDFPSEELMGIENIITVPHLGASTPESEDNCAGMAASQLVDFLENGNIVNSVNFPNVTMPRTTKLRYGVVHKNIPNMLSQITNAFSSSQVNIENMASKSKKDYAYTILDIAGEVSGAFAEKIQAIEGIVRVYQF